MKTPSATHISEIGYLQHTCFTILLARGTPLKHVQDLAGHASIHLHHPAPKQEHAAPDCQSHHLPAAHLHNRPLRVNFSYMPETQWRYDFYAILALCTSLAVEMLV